jgi:hypothetical protein
MPGFSFLLILFLFGIILGALRTSSQVRSSRRAAPKPGSLMAWTEKPLPAWRYETHAVAAILVHVLGILVLGLLALRTLLNDSILSNPLFTNDLTMIGLAWVIQCGGILFVGLQLGSSLIASFLVVFRKKSLGFAITEKGLLFDRNFMPWSWFSRYDVDSHSGIYRLYSAFLPDLPSLILKPPETVSLLELNKLLQQFLPKAQTNEKHAWYRTRFLLILAILIACLVTIYLGTLALNLTLELGLFTMFVLLTILVQLGGMIFNLCTFGVLNTKSHPPG